MKEQGIQKKILNMLEKDFGAYVVKVQVASKSGVPDIICCCRGIFIGIEVKKEETKGDTSPLQEYNLRKIKRAGGYAMVATSKEQVEEFLNEILKSSSS